MPIRQANAPSLTPAICLSIGGVRDKYLVLQELITAPMSRSLWDLYIFSSPEVLEDDDLIVVRVGGGSGLLYPGIHTPFGPVERDAVSLVGGVGGERVRDLYAILVLDGCSHLVIDVYVVPEHAAIAMVTVVLLVVHVQADEDLSAVTSVGVHRFV